MYFFISTTLIISLQFVVKYYIDNTIFGKTILFCYNFLSCKLKTGLQPMQNMSLDLYCYDPRKTLSYKVYWTYIM